MIFGSDKAWGVMASGIAGFRVSNDITRKLPDIKSLRLPLENSRFRQAVPGAPMEKPDF